MNKYGLDLELEEVTGLFFWQTNQFYLLITFLLLLLMVGGIVIWRVRRSSRLRPAVLDQGQLVLSALNRLNMQLQTGMPAELFYTNLIFQIKIFIKNYYTVDVAAMTTAELVQAVGLISGARELAIVLKRIQGTADLAQFGHKEIEHKQMNDDLQGVLSVLKQILQLSK
jgi:hypothetical protein